MYLTHRTSPLGHLTLASDGSSLTGLWIENQKYFAAGLDREAVAQVNLPIFQQTILWLDAYFSRQSLPVIPPLAPKGTPFQQAVWQLLTRIPYGQTTTYGALAQTLQENGISASAQAVGGAVGRNPISILIPCHRVLGANGSLTGYAGGVKKKRFLLELEGVALSPPPISRHPQNP